MAASLLSSDLAHDATDCRALVGERGIALMPVYSAGFADGAPFDSAGVDFGDNSSEYKDDGECDDPQFIGPGMASMLAANDELRDAADCEAKFIAGLVVLKDTAAATPPPEQLATPATPGTPSPEVSAVDFGDDTSAYANNNECDDLRFVGEGMDVVLQEGDIGHDATDCRTLVESRQGRVPGGLRAGLCGRRALRHRWPRLRRRQLNLCQQRRMRRPAVRRPRHGGVLQDDDIRHDAADCKAKFVAGLVALKG